MDLNEKKPRQNAAALLPILVFLVLYLGMGLVFEYGLGVEMAFYNIPIVVVFMVALLVACLQNRALKLDSKLAVMAQGVGDKNIMTMLLIFLVAGVFVGVTGRSSAEAVAYFLLSVTPAWASVAVLFVAACFVSIAMGTSVGTITLITPIAAAVSHVSGFSLALCVGSVIGGAMFGDNLSFISDTTIAATRTQGCKMNEKFKANCFLAIPAALITFAIYIFGDFSVPESTSDLPSNPWLVLPYLAVIVLAISGVNVTVTLVSGIILSFIIALFLGFDLFELLGFMGSGIEGMGNLIIITLMAAGMLGLIKAAGGIDALIHFLSGNIRGGRAAQGVISVLVGIVNLCTANNTVAILTVGSISKDIADKFGISGRRSASLLDTSSCIVQCLIPYGAQTLLATSLAGISPTAPWPYLFYPWILAGIVCLSILFKQTVKAPLKKMSQTV